MSDVPSPALMGRLYELIDQYQPTHYAAVYDEANDSWVMMAGTGGVTE